MTQRIWYHVVSGNVKESGKLILDPHADPDLDPHADPDQHQTSITSTRSSLARGRRS